MTLLKQIKELQKKMKDMQKKSLLQAKLLNKEIERLEKTKCKYISNQKRPNPVVNEERSYRMSCYKAMKK